MGLIGSFFGRDQKKDLAAAKAQSDAALSQGYDQAQADYTQAENYFSPYSQLGQSGIRNQGFYDDALGMNGEGARNQAVGTITSNPLFQGQLGQESNAVSRVLNAQGASGGGQAHLAAQRVFQQNAGNWLDRYAQNAQQGVQTGLQATNAMSGLRAGRGDMAYGYGATKAGNAINFGNAMAANRSTGINNLMGLAGTVVSGINAFRQPKLGS
jgi:hypothetical protein